MRVAVKIELTEEECLTLKKMVTRSFHTLSTNPTCPNRPARCRRTAKQADRYGTQL